MFCTSVSDYRYKYSKFITAPMIHDRRSDIIVEKNRKSFVLY